MALPLLDPLTARVIEFLSLNSHLAYAWLSPELKISQASDNFQRMLATGQSSVDGDCVTNIVLEFSGAEQELQQVLSGEKPEYRLEKVNRQQADGSTVYYDFRIIPFDPSYPQKGLIMIAGDFSQARRLEQNLIQDRNELRLAQEQLARSNAELQRLSRLKTLFLSIAAHDLRAPLSAVHIYTDILLSEIPENSPAEHREYLAQIEQQIALLDHLIDDLLDLDQIEQGKLSINPAVCDLNQLAEQVAAGMKGLASRQGLSLDLNTPAVATPILADPKRVRQILFNLISNAIKYTPEGGRIQVRVWPEQDCSIFQVEDNGSGIPQTDFPHLFDLYYRSESTRSKQIRGAGLGLYIVKSLVEAQQGQIQVTSLPGQNTTFTVYLPSARLSPAL